MGWLSLLKLVLTLSASIAEIVEDKQLLDAGEAKNVAKTLREQNERVEKALTARRDVKHDPDSLRNDLNRRD